jgi:hypothetical protein
MKKPGLAGFFHWPSNIKPAYPQIKIKDYSGAGAGAILMRLKISP